MAGPVLKKGGDYEIAWKMCSKQEAAGGEPEPERHSDVCKEL